jgi:hypothetical protein
VELVSLVEGFASMLDAEATLVAELVVVVDWRADDGAGTGVNDSVARSSSLRREEG